MSCSPPAPPPPPPSPTPPPTRRKRVLDLTETETTTTPLKKITTPPPPPTPIPLSLPISNCLICRPISTLPVLTAAQLFIGHPEYRCLVGSFDDPRSSQITARPIAPLSCLDAHHWAVNSATTNLKPAPHACILPEHDMKQENKYPSLQYGEMVRLTIAFGGMWIGWQSSVPLKGKLSVTTTFHEPLANQYAPHLPSREVSRWLQPTVEYLLPDFTLHHTQVNDVPVKLTHIGDRLWAFSLSVRACQNLVQLQRRLARTEKQHSILTFHFKFTLAPECAQKNLVNLMSQLKSHPYFHEELERITKLASTPSTGHYSVQVNE